MDNKKVILVLFGVTGDLSKRKILPAIEKLAKGRKLPTGFSVFGITRQDVQKEKILGALVENKNLHNLLKVEKMDLNKIKSYNTLYSQIKNKDKDIEVIFYLSVPEEQMKKIIGKIGQSDLQKIKNKKLLIEKPFGRDLKSAEKLSQYLKQFFKESETYRIDHYLLKDVSKKIIEKRQKDKSLEEKWNSNFIEKIEIVASESLGIENRSLFYEKTGALRDMVQSHLLNLLANVLMEIPPEDGVTVPYSKQNALKHLHLHANETKRAQYEGYKEETNNTGSTTETFVRVSLESKHPRWQNVKIILVTGKGLDKKDTYIKIYFKDKTLTLRENTKKVKNSYEEVLLRSIEGDKKFFLTDEKILDSWRVLKALQHNWQKNKENLIIYKKGSKLEDVV